jgi:integrase
MSINTKNYKTVTKNLKISKKDNREFLFDFRIDGKRYRKVEILSCREGWNKADYTRQAQTMLIEYRKNVEIRQGDLTITHNTKLNDMWDIYIKILDPNKRWTQEKVSFYERIISPHLGKKAIGAIQEHHITSIIRTLQDEGKATRTINTILEILKPLFDYAIKNRGISDNPAKFITLKKDNTKKPVINATALFKRIYGGIIDFYKDEPFYRALFLFGFTGRRKGEILNLQWKNIDLENNYYWIEYTKNNERQKYALPHFVKEAILQIKSDHKGLVFQSPITGEKLKNTDRQMLKLKQYLNLPQLTLHYMRNVLVSALAEQGTEAITLSGVLGHRDATTINKYLSLSYHNSSKKGNETINNIIDVEVY